MKTLLRLLPLIFVFSLSSCGSPEKDVTIKVMTFNVRFDNPGDGVNAWPNRIPIVEKYMNEEMPDIVGMQENLHHQNQDLLQIMPGYAYVGTGRDDGKEGGEFSPIFYRKEVFELLEDAQFWLSETPDVPGSIGWEAIFPRVVAWAKLQHIESGNALFVFNTHFSHVSDLARRKSMEFMAEQVNAIAGAYPIIVMGDFNITKGSDLYFDMIAHLDQNNNLSNAEYLSETPVKNADATFNAFRDDIAPRVIDYIFVDDHFDVLSYGVDKVKEGDVFISDHWPVRAELRVRF